MLVKINKDSDEIYTFYTVGSSSAGLVKNDGSEKGIELSDIDITFALDTDYFKVYGYQYVNRSGEFHMYKQVCWTLWPIKKD